MSLTKRPARRPVLLIEDETTTRGALAEALTVAGFRVYVAANGRDALWQLSQVPERPCVLVLDLDLPVLSGPELLDTLEKQGQLEAFPTVVVTGAERVPAGLKARQVLKKPVKLRDVVDAVRALHAPPAPAGG